MVIENIENRDFLFFCGPSSIEGEGCFSNFFRSSFGYFPTSEHYYMFQKAAYFNDIDSMQKIMGNGLTQTTPKEVKILDVI